MTESGLKAKDELNNKMINGNTITIGFTSFDSSILFFQQQIQKQNNIIRNNENETSIFVFDIPEYFDEKMLYDIFKEFKVIGDEDGVLIKTKFNYDSKITKYAIIRFYTKSDAEEAIRSLNYNKYHGIPIRLVLADSETIKILSTNKGKLLISNLDKEIEVSQLHDLFENFGQIIECEIPSDAGVSRGYGYVHFRNEKDAIQAKSDLRDVSIKGKKICIDLLEEPTPNDQEKKYLTEINIQNVNNYRQKDISNFQKLFIPDFSLYDRNDDIFIIYVNEKRVDCSFLIASFLSPKISFNIQNDDSFSHFIIKVDSIDKIESIEIELVQLLISLLKEYPSKSKLQQLIIELIERIITSTINEIFEKTIQIIIDECTESLLGNKEKTDEYILSFIMLIEIFSQFGNDKIIQYVNSLLFQNIQNCETIINDQVLYIKHSIRKIMKEPTENNDEIIYIRSNFIEIDPEILNQIESKTIKESISSMEINHRGFNEDQFLYQILRLKDKYKKKFIHFVDFESVTNEAMKFFLSTIDFSIFSIKFLKSISKRLTLNLLHKYDERPNEISNIFREFINHGIENSLSKRNIKEKDFTIFIEECNKKLDINSKIATIISPLIKRNLQTDKTFSTFYLRLESQVDIFNEIIQSLTYFKSKDDKFEEFDLTTFENKIFDHLIHMNDMIENKGMNYLINFLTKLNIEEENSTKYTEWILLFICLGNYKISEFLINLFIKTHDRKINNNEELIQRIEHKEVLKYGNSIEVDNSNETNYIINNFEDFFKNINSFEDIKENHWKILSIRLSVDVHVKSKEKCSHDFTDSDHYCDVSDSDHYYDVSVPDHYCDASDSDHYCDISDSDDYRNISDLFHL